MLNRTLLVPPSTLGVAVDWAPSPKLQANIELAERSIPSKCRKIRDKAARRAEVSIMLNGEVELTSSAPPSSATRLTFATVQS